jgi:UDP-N-acetylglucosamine 3-dehydrogenase
MNRDNEVFAMGQHKRVLKVAVVGAGAMGRNHVRVLSELDRTELVAVVDKVPEVREAIRASTGCQTFEHVEEVIAAGIDAAVVALPTVHHHATVLQLIEAGIHVLVEKPIAATVAEARDMIQASVARGVVLTVGHVERFNPAVGVLRAALGDEQITSIAISRVGPFPPRVTDVGIVIDLGVHDIDLIRWLARSEIVDSQSLLTRARGGHEDIAFLQFRLATGALAHINTNWLTPFKERRISVSTPSRFIVGDLLLRTVNEYSGFSAGVLPDKFGQGSFVSRSLGVPFVEPLHAEITAFLDAVEGRRAVAVTGEDGLRSLEIALECLQREPVATSGHAGAFAST